MFSLSSWEYFAGAKIPSMPELKTSNSDLHRALLFLSMQTTDEFHFRLWLWTSKKKIKLLHIRYNILDIWHGGVSTPTSNLRGRHFYHWANEQFANAISITTLYLTYMKYLYTCIQERIHSADRGGHLSVPTKVNLLQFFRISPRYVLQTFTNGRGAPLPCPSPSQVLFISPPKRIVSYTYLLWLEVLDLLQ